MTYKKPKRAIPNPQRFRIKIGKKYIALIKINFKTQAINKYDVFEVNDVFTERGDLGISIKTKFGIEEALFKHPNLIKSRDQLLEGFHSFCVPYIEGAKYHFINSQE